MQAFLRLHELSERVVEECDGQKKRNYCQMSSDFHSSVVFLINGLFEASTVSDCFPFWKCGWASLVISRSVWMPLLVNFLALQLLVCVSSNTAKTCLCLKSAFNLNAVDGMKALVKATQVLTLAKHQRLKNRGRDLNMLPWWQEIAECEAVNRIAAFNWTSD